MNLVAQSNINYLTTSVGQKPNMGPIGLKSRCQQGYTPFWRPQERIHFQAQAFWHNLVLCGCRTEVLLSWLSISCGSLTSLSIVLACSPFISESLMECVISHAWKSFPSATSVLHPVLLPLSDRLFHFLLLLLRAYMTTLHRSRQPRIISQC